jgi:spore germination protein
VAVVFPWLVGTADSMESFRTHAGAMTHISPTWLSMDGAGAITTTEQPEVAEVARAQSLKLCPLVVNERFQAASAEGILKDPDRRRANAERLCDLVEAKGWAGLNLDFEGPWHTCRDEYADFVDRIARRLRPRGVELSIDVVCQTRSPLPVPPEAGATDIRAWRAVFDYEALAPLVDHFVLMGYDYHTRHTNPGPVGPTWWLREVLDWTLRFMAPAKVVLGLPFYGRNWTVAGRQNLGESDAFTYSQVTDLITRLGGTPAYDWDADSWQYRCAEGGKEKVLWFDTDASLATRLDLVREYGLGGVAFWRLGQEDQRIWEAVAALRGR